MVFGVKGYQNIKGVGCGIVLGCGRYMGLGGLVLVFLFLDYKESVWFNVVKPQGLNLQQVEISRTILVNIPRHQEDQTCQVR